MRETGTLDRLTEISDDNNQKLFLKEKVFYQITLDDDDDFEDDEDEELEKEEEKDKKNKKYRGWNLFD